MGKRVYSKLVRDRIPEIIAADGKVAVTRVLELDEYVRKLRAKLVEEARETEVAAEGDLAAELADVLEVVYALAVAEGLSIEFVEAVRRQRAEERGGFGRRIELIETSGSGDV